jgi:hypothetical protein
MADQRHDGKHDRKRDQDDEQKIQHDRPRCADKTRIRIRLPS